MKQDRRRQARSFTRMGDAYLIGTVFPIAILLGLGFGWLADKLLGTWPWLTVVFGIIGVAAGFLEAIRTALRVGREEDRVAQGGGGSESDDAAPGPGEKDRE